MKKIIVLFLGMFLSCNLAISQTQTENWESYIAYYEGGKPGSTTVRMDLINSAPLSGYNYVLVTGITYESEREDGFPKGDQTFKLLHKIGDELEAILNRNGENILVGSFMHNFERLEYFYLKSDEGIKKKIEQFYKTSYPNKKYYLNIKEDKNWEYYTQFLYPNEETINYMEDQKVLEALKNAGDNLTKARRIDHWAYFSDNASLELFKKEVIEQGFKIESSGKIEDENMPYRLRFHRVDNVDIDSIYPVTSSLRKMSMKYKGDYDGWETSVETD
ncbi:DUF695 domain-containing protein [Flavivirga spongiicola]|uniref:DUF695 domain-containing protein n=1 Tax=Flavivirga spongiicola TaxID=421621 RepID=A0ABU7XTT7_9FLAO|nr:DUF695 domain-containing protein [Flavivirga sp. MEBiC05379]MDO5979190.1 DUF695 domain-containing protein [Flavivirga sp. MEBiC05379]